MNTSGTHFFMKYRSKFNGLSQIVVLMKKKITRHALRVVTGLMVSIL